MFSSCDNLLARRGSQQIVVTKLIATFSSVALIFLTPIA